jgi:hypothetical protein
MFSVRHVLSFQICYKEQQLNFKRLTTLHQTHKCYVALMPLTIHPMTERVRMAVTPQVFLERCLVQTSARTRTVLTEVLSPSEQTPRYYPRLGHGHVLQHTSQSRQAHRNRLVILFAILLRVPETLGQYALRIFCIWVRHI